MEAKGMNVDFDATYDVLRLLMQAFARLTQVEPSKLAATLGRIREAIEDGVAGLG